MSRDKLRHSVRWLDGPATAGLVLLAIVATLALTAPLLPMSDPNAIDAAHRLEMPTPGHPLGTDDLGRDLLSRLVWGSRSSLGAVAAATMLIMSIGVVVGVVAGFTGGLVDEFLMRLVDVFLAIPSLLLALAIGGMLGPGLSSILIALAGVWWASYARMIRGLIIELRDRDFLVAARSLGGTRSHVVLRHILPNVLPTVVVLATTEMGDLILAVAALSFLGIGVQPPNPEWGTMISDARPYVLSKPLLAIWPGIAITLTAVAFNVVGDAVRDRLDPRISTRRLSAPG